MVHVKHIAQCQEQDGCSKMLLYESFNSIRQEGVYGKRNGFQMRDTKFHSQHIEFRVSVEYLVVIWK